MIKICFFVKVRWWVVGFFLNQSVPSPWYQDLYYLISPSTSTSIIVHLLLFFRPFKWWWCLFLPFFFSFFRCFIVLGHFSDMSAFLKVLISFANVVKREDIATEHAPKPFQWIFLIWALNLPPCLLCVNGIVKLVCHCITMGQKNRRRIKRKKCTSFTFGIPNLLF